MDLMQRYTTTEELDQATWDSFVNRHPKATSYHLYRWKEVIEQSFGHRTRYLAALDGGGTVRGVLPLVHMKSALFGNFLVSIPFVNYGGLLCASDGARDRLLSAAEALRREVGAEHVELRHLGQGVAGLPSKEHKVTMVLPLAEGAEAQWAGFNAKLRNQVRKAEKSGLTFKRGGVELLDDFYRVFARNMRDLGTPVYGKKFFRKVIGSFREECSIAAVSCGEKVIAAGILYRYRDVMEMPWASSIADYKQLCPNNLLYWESIRFALEQGCARFDFGRSTPNEGTYHFKKQWGAAPVQLYWQYLLQREELPELTPRNPKYALAIKLWKRLPVSLTKVIGPGLVRNIP